MRYLSIIFLLIPFTLEANWKSERESLDKVLIKNEFRLFYTMQGVHGIPNYKKTDSNLDGIPDYIENLANRLVVSDYIFKEIFKFRNPLDSPRYKDKAKFIDIHLMASKNNGSAGDAIIYFNYRNFPSLSDSVITIKLSNKLSIRNMTPTHELFHLYQNGYTMFKNRWYTEGTARWSEYIFKKGVGSRESLPNNSVELMSLLSKTYGSKTFWHQLAYLFDKNDGQFELPITSSDNMKILFSEIVEDKSIYGYGFMKKLLEELDFMDDFASNDYGVDNYKWKETLQKSSSNNNYILCALKNTMLKMSERIFILDEVEQLIILIDKFTNNECIRIN